MRLLNRIFFCLMVLFCLTPFTWAKYIAVLETISSAKDSAGADMLTLQERQYLTDILRGEAVKVLPAEQNFTIMTRDNINVMLPPGKSIEECEGSCLAETGRNIAADYVAQARIWNVGGSLAISAEIYETAGNKLLASFNGRGADVGELEKVIRTGAAEFFNKAKGSNAGWNGVSGFSDISSGETFSVAGKKSFIVDVATDPAGASLSIDGRPVPKCMQTPCKVQVEEGEHRFVLVKDRYDDVEQLVVISSANKDLSFSLSPNFGYLDLRPTLPGNLGNPENIFADVDTQYVRPGTIILDPGIHDVRVSHPCYDPMVFKVGIQKNKTETFTESLKRGIGGLKLSAEWNGEPQAVPVYVDDEEVGSTPFLGEVPLCAKVAVGEPGALENVNVELKWHETVEYTHALKNTPVAVALTKDVERTADSIETANNEATADAAQVGESIPTNVDSEGFKIHWVPVGISAAVAVTGTVLAIVGNSKAKSTHDKEPADADEYKKNKDDIHSAQALRTVGIVTAIVGAVGLGVSFVF